MKTINCFDDHAPKRDWLVSFFDLKDDFFTEHSLGPNMFTHFKRFLRDDGMIKISRNLKENQWKIKRAMEQFAHEHGREATVEELSVILKLEPEEIVLSMEAAVEIESMDQKVFRGDGKEISLKERIPDEKNEEEELLDKLFLEQLMEGLDKRDKELIILRYFENKTQTQVAKSLGISQVQVSRLEKKILLRMRECAGFAVKK